MSTPLISIFVFVAALLLFEAVRNLLRGRRGAAQVESRKRLAKLAAGLTAPVEEGASALRKRRARAGEGFDGFLRTLPGYDRMRLQLYRAGLGFGPARLLTICAGFGLAGFLGAQIASPGGGASVLFAIFGLAPWFYVNSRANRRLYKFEAQLPEALDLLTRALRAGQSLTSGFRMVAAELPDPIGFEFAQVADQVQLGHDLPSALNDFAYRIQSRSVPFLVTAIVIQRETGSNLAEVLNNLATVIRERFRFYGKVSALTAMGRFSANILAVWPVVMVGAIYLANPSYIEPLWTTDEGIRMIMLCVPMVIVGYLICRRMAVVEV